MLAPILLAASTLGGCAARAPHVAESDQTDGAARALADAPLDTTARWVRVQMAWSDESAHAWTNDSLRMVLLEMARVDQAVRHDLTPERVADTVVQREMRQVDSANAAHLRAIIARVGWPTKSMVGARGASAAWVIVQHSADLQVEGERLMLAARKGEVSPSDLAMLIDRRLVSQNRPQRFGTQLKPFENGTTAFYPIEDPAGLEERRANVGLPPLAEYVQMIESMYHAKVVGPR